MITYLLPLAKIPMYLFQKPTRDCQYLLVIFKGFDEVFEVSQ